MHRNPVLTPQNPRFFALYQQLTTCALFESPLFILFFTMPFSLALPNQVDDMSFQLTIFWH